MRRLESTVARVELALGALTTVVGVLGLVEAGPHLGRGGPAPALWLTGSSLLLSLGLGAVGAGLVLRRGGRRRWSGQILLLALPALALALLQCGVS